MNNTYDYEEDKYEEGITWKKVGRFFVKGWLRMVVYVAACVLLAVAIALPIREFYKTEPVAQTTVEFVYSGIERGVAPDGSQFSTDSIISTAVIADAIVDAGLTSKLTDVSAVRHSLRVESVVSKEYSQLLKAAATGDETAVERLLDYTFYPTQFNIILSRPDELDLTDSQARLLLDKIVTSYYKDFRKHYSVSDMFSVDTYTLSQNADLEFTDAYDMYIDAFASIRDVLTEMHSKSPTFVSAQNNSTFAQLIGELNILVSNYNLFNANTLSGNIWRNPARAESSLIASRSDIENNMTPLQDYIKALTKQIEEIKPSETVTTVDPNGNPVIVEKYPTKYYAYHDKLDEANRQLRDYQVRFANIETRLTALKNESANDNKEAIAATVTALAKLESDAVAFVDKVNATIEDYYEVTYISSSVRQTAAAEVTRLGTNFDIWKILGVAAIVGLLAACVVTVVKISRNPAKKAKQTLAQPETVEIADKQEKEEKKEVDKAE